LEALGDSAADGESAPDRNLLGMTGDAARSAFDALFSIGASAWGSAMRDSSFSGDPRELSVSEDAHAAEEAGVDDVELGDATIGEGAMGEGAMGGGQSLDSAEVKPSGELGAEETSPAKRRRSRRRRGGRGRKSASEEVATGAGEASEADSPAAGASDGSARRSLGEDSHSKASGTPGEKKPRRRRSRRRPRAADAPGERSDENTRSEQSDLAGGDREVDDLVADDGELYSDGDPGEQTTSEERERSGSIGKTRTSHRNLPTWSDAIGVIVDANLELHSKSPSRQTSSRGRGGRSRGGRGRGGGSKS